jgi:hypothetical protein
MMDKKIIMTMFLTSNIYMNVYSDSSKEYVFMKLPSNQEINPLNTNITNLGCNNWDPPLTYHCHVQGGNLF